MGKSWSGLRKKLEQEFLCEKLRGRVQYFITHYHGAPDEYGRACVRVDGDEHVMGNPYSYYVKGYPKIENEIKRQNDVPRRVYSNGKFQFNEENLIVEKQVRDMARNEGVFEIYDLTNAIREYTQSPINESLYSDDDLVRMLAVMDYRVGKRTLEKISRELFDLPEWLLFFYKLRLDAEGITYESSELTANQ